MLEARAIIDSERGNMLLFRTIPSQVRRGGYMEPASLFIGRWAPFHEGHQALIESVLTTGKPVFIQRELVGRQEAG